MSLIPIERVPLAALAARDPDERLPDLPIAYIPWSVPEGLALAPWMARAVSGDSR